jgi:lipase
MLLHVHEWGNPEARPLVCLHGVTAHARRFRKLAEERLAARFRVLAPDLRGHGRSGWEPPWTFATLVDDVVETVDAAGVDGAVWLGHSLGGRLVLELAARTPERIERAVLLDPAIQVLAHVGLDFAERQLAERTFGSAEEAVQTRLATDPATPRPYLEEEAREHLERRPDGRLEFRYCRSTAVSVYGELCAPAPPPETLRAPTLLLYADEFGLVREEQVAAYQAALGDALTVVAVSGGHVVYWDAFEQTADAVEEFLA